MSEQNIAYQSTLFNTAEYVDNPLVGLERCESPARAIDDLLDNLPFCVQGTILEPCSGNGMLVEPMRARGYQVITNDIDPRIPADMHYDAQDPTVPYFDGYDWVITNPPFSQAQAILENLLPRVRFGCLFLLLVSFSEPTVDRDKLFQTWKPNGQITTPRYRFYGDHDYSQTTAWYGWLTGNPILYPGAIPGFQVFSRKSEFYRIAKCHGK